MAHQDRDKTFRDTCNVFIMSDVSNKSGELPTTFEGTISFIKSLPEILSETNNGKGVPLVYSLQPLEDVCKVVNLDLKLATTFKAVEEDMIMVCSKELEKIVLTRQSINDLKIEVTQNSDVISHDIIGVVEELESTFAVEEMRLRHELGQALIIARSTLGSDRSVVLKDVLHKFKESELTPVFIDKRIRELRSLFKDKLKFVKLLRQKGVVFIGQHGNMDDILDLNPLGDTSTYVMYINDGVFGNAQSGLSKLRQDTFVFFQRLIRSAGPQTRLFLIDLSQQENAPLEVSSAKALPIIQEYLNGCLLCNDLLAKLQSDINVNYVDNTTESRVFHNRPRKLIKATLPCPYGALGRGKCSSQPVEWSCFRCRDIVSFDLISMSCFYCSCGFFPTCSTVFRCANPNHGFDFVGFAQPSFVQEHLCGEELMSIDKSESCHLILPQDPNESGGRRPAKTALAKLTCPNKCSDDGLIVQWKCQGCFGVLEIGLEVDDDPDQRIFFCESCGIIALDNCKFKCPKTSGFQKCNISPSWGKEIGSLTPIEKECIVLVIGEESLKPRWINGFVNYWAYANIEEALVSGLQAVCRSTFSILSKDHDIIQVNIGQELGNQSSAGGKMMMMKTFNIYKKNEVLRIIDVGPDADINELWSEMESFSHLSGICLLIPPIGLSPKSELQNRLVSVLRSLPMKLVHSLLLCTSANRGAAFRPADTLINLQRTLKELGVKNVEISPRNYFSLDSDAFRFVACIKKGIKFEEDDYRDFSQGWIRSSKETARLIETLNQLQPIKMGELCGINQARNLILLLSEPIACSLLDIESTLAHAEAMLDDIDDSKQVYMIFTKVIEDDQIRSLCRFTSHNEDDKCPRARFDTVCQCWLFNGHGFNCDDCSFESRAHKHVKFRMIRCKKPLLDIKLIKDLGGYGWQKKKSIDVTINEIKEAMCQLQEEKTALLNLASQFAWFSESAMIFGQNSVLAFMEMHTQEKGDLRHELLKSSFVKRKSSFKSTGESVIDFSNLGNLYQSINDIYELKLYGDHIKRMVELIQQISENK